MTVQILRRRFTVEEYYRIAAAGILHEDVWVELIDGEIVQMAAIGSKHAAGVKRLIVLFSHHTGQRFLIGAQDPVRLSQYSEPQPDIALLRLRPDYYAGAHPGPGDVLLLVEVMVTSEEYDREVKVSLYARSGIVEVWLVDLEADHVEVYRSPGPEGYRQVQRVHRGERLAPEAFPHLKLLADDVLGPHA